MHKEDTEGNYGTRDGFQRSAENCASRSRKNTKYVSNDAGHIKALTPNRFLLLRANPSHEDAEVSDSEISSTKMWRQS